jgi:hypothetical protein
MPPPSDMPYYLGPTAALSLSTRKPHSTVSSHVDLKNDAAGRGGHG